MTGCPAYNTILVNNYLQAIFGNRVIRMNRNICWPARFRDLFPNGAALTHETVSLGQLSFQELLYSI